VREEPRHDPPRLALEQTHPLELLGEQPVEIRRQVDKPGLVVLGGARVEAELLDTYFFLVGAFIVSVSPPEEREHARLTLATQSGAVRPVR
jgi:hypothetical protein